MFKRLMKGLQAGIAVGVLAEYRLRSMQLLKIEATRAYVQGVQMARLSAFGLMRLGLLLGMIGLGVVLVHASVFVLLPWDLKAKAWIGLALGVAYTVIGGVALRATMDERTWMEKSGASKMLDDAAGTPDRD